uniref:Oxoeicosanoid receptor 1 n=1 Tax=Latimeria chalumnae TaxID=7897 RepID=H3ANL0_LATCH
MSSNNTYCFSVHHIATDILLPTVIVEFILGLTGNSIALWIFCFHLKTWKPSTVYLLNLVAADFLLITSLPFRLDYSMRNEDWIFGDVLCRFSLFMLSMNRTASVCFLSVITIDRYFKVVHPHHKINKISVVSAAKIACLIWILIFSSSSFLLSSSYLMSHKNKILCRSFNSHKTFSISAVWHMVVFVTEFFLPLGIILFCTLRIIWKLKRRRLCKNVKIKRTVNVMIIIVVAFIICFSPSILAGFAVLIIKTWMRGNCVPFQIATQIFSTTILFTYLNSVLDPILYCFMSPSFKSIYKKVISFICLCGKKVDENSDSEFRGTISITYSESRRTISITQSNKRTELNE